MRALVVDDSRTMRLILKRLLKAQGFEVDEAENGQKALDKIHGPDAFDLTLVDWTMPEMNGLDFVKAARSEQRFDTMRILVVTSQTEIEQINRALEAGADEYLMKPFDAHSLQGKLELLDFEVDAA